MLFIVFTRDGRNFLFYAFSSGIFSFLHSQTQPNVIYRNAINNDYDKFELIYF